MLEHTTYETYLRILREELAGRFGCDFAAPDFSADNAAGVAILASVLWRRQREGC